MAKQPFENVVQHLFQIAAQVEFKSLSDQDLLKRYVECRDELAFGELVRRYKGMVWYVCWRVLRHHQDVEDAFQATVMTLVRRARTILSCETIEGWLHKAAFRVASNAKVARVRRHTREDRSATMRRESSESPEGRWDLGEVLDQELIRIPEEYRNPLILCYLEGLSRSEAAQRLGISLDSLKWRLEQGRERLKKRLNKYGMDLGSTMLITDLKTSMHATEVPSGLVEKTLDMVRIVTLSNGALETVGIPAEVATLVKGAMGVTLKMKLLLGSMLVSLMVVTAGAVKYAGILRLTLGTPMQDGKSEPVNSIPAEPKTPKVLPRVDRYGDPLPLGAMARLGTVRFRDETSHGQGNIFLVPTKTTPVIVATEGSNTRLKLWELSTGKPLPHLKDAQGNVIPITDQHCLSHDGRLIAVVRNPEAELKDREFCFWNMDTGKQLSMRSEMGLSRIALSPDGKTMAAVIGHDERGKSDYKLHIWDNVTEKELWMKRSGRKPKDANTGDFPVQLIYSSDGKTILALYSGKMNNGKNIENMEGVVRRWEVATGKELPRWSIGIKESDSWAWSSDGSTLALVVLDEQRPRNTCVSLWNMSTGREVQQICSNIDGKPDMSLSADGKVLAVSYTCEEGGRGIHKVSLWDTETGNLLRHCDNHNLLANSMVFAHDGSVLVGRCGHTIHVWDVGTGKETNQVWFERGHNSAVCSIAFASQGKTLISKDDEEVFLWEVHPTTGPNSFQKLKDPLKLQIEKRPGKSSICAISPDSKYAASFGMMASEDKQSIESVIKIWEVTTGKERKSFSMPAVPNQRFARILLGPKPMQFSPDGKILAFYHRVTEEKARFSFWEIATGRQVCSDTCEATRELDIKLNFSPDSKILYSVERVHGNSETKNRKDAAFIFRSLEVATGKIVFSSTASFRSARGQLIANHITSWAFSPDGRTLATIAWLEMAPKMHLWRVRADEHVVRLDRPSELGKADKVEFSAHDRAYSLEPYVLAFSPDSKTLATVYFSSENRPVVHIWEVTTGRIRYQFNKHNSACCLANSGKRTISFAYFPDSRCMASAQPNTTILLWDLTGRQEDGHLRPAQLSPQAKEKLWKDLSSSDAATAGEAIWSLVAAGDATVPFFKRQLRPAQARQKLPVKNINRLIADLDHIEFGVRQKARKELTKHREEAEPVLRRILEIKKPSLEVRRSIEAILAPLDYNRLFVVPPPAEELRSLRAIEVLEQIGSQNACQLLEELGHGAPEARQTEEAKVSLRWLRQRSQR